MKVVEEAHMPSNTGRAFIVKKGQRIRLWGETHIDFIPFNLDNMTERFDQGRTRAHEGKVWLSTGDKLWTKFCNPIMTFVEDTYKGTHDMQYGMCSKLVYDRIYEQLKAGDPAVVETWGWKGMMNREDWPDHGCWENMQDALKGYDIAPECIPSPINIFQGMDIVGPTGKLIFLLDENRPEPGKPDHVDLRAEMNCLCAVSACPARGWGKAIKVEVFDE